MRGCKQRVNRSERSGVWGKGSGVEKATRLASEGLSELLAVLEGAGLQSRRARILACLGECLEIVRDQGESD